MNTTAVKKQKTNFKELKKGTVISETQYYKVEKIVGDQVQLQNDNGEDIVVDRSYAEGCLNTADQYITEETKSRTEIVQIFTSHPYTAMTVNFNKQVKQADVLKEIMGTHQNTAPKDVEKAFKASIKKALEGEERTMVGRHYASQDEFGRYHFIDMNADRDPIKDYDTRNRLVDPRTINWLIVKGVKYNVK